MEHEQTQAQERSRIGKLSVRKGKTFERDIVNEINECLAKQELDEVFLARRGYQSRGGGECPDVGIIEKYSNRVIVHIECKHHHRPNIPSALDQATADATPTAIAVAITKADHEDPIVSLCLDDFKELLTACLSLKVETKQEPVNVAGELSEIKKLITQALGLIEVTRVS